MKRSFSKKKIYYFVFDRFFNFKFFPELALNLFILVAKKFFEVRKISSKFILPSSKVCVFYPGIFDWCKPENDRLAEQSMYHNGKS